MDNGLRLRTTVLLTYIECGVCFDSIHELAGEAVVRCVDDEGLVVEEGVGRVEDIAGHGLTV